MLHETLLSAACLSGGRDKMSGLSPISNVVFALHFFFTHCARRGCEATGVAVAIMRYGDAVGRRQATFYELDSSTDAFSKKVSIIER